MDVDAVDIEKLQPTADEIMSKKGNIIGHAVNAQSDYVLKQKGVEGLRKVEAVMEKLGYPFSFEDGNLSRFEMFPENYDVLRVYVAKELFGWTDKNLFEMGRNSHSISQPMRVAMGFISMERTFKNASRFWDKYFDFGRLDPVEIHMDEGWWTVRMVGYDFHPIMEEYFKGYMSGVLYLTEGVESTKVEHEYCELESGE